jgi:hypothetical protein
VHEHLTQLGLDYLFHHVRVECDARTALLAASGTSRPSCSTAEPPSWARRDPRSRRGGSPSGLPPRSPLDAVDERAQIRAPA